MEEETNPMLDDLKLELGIADSGQDSLLTRYLTKAEAKVKEVTKQSDEYLQEHLQIYIVDVAVLMYNRKGTEGIANQSVAGMSESYLADLPTDLKRSLYAHRRLGGAL